jgi:hypothetical protein
MAKATKDAHRMNSCVSSFKLVMGSIYRTVRGLVYIVQTTPNCPENDAEYMVMWTLQ